MVLADQTEDEILTVLKTTKAEFSLYEDHNNAATKDHGQPANLEEDANYWQQLFFSYMTDVIEQGSSLTAKDVWKIHKDDEVEKNTGILANLWDAEVAEFGADAQLVRCLWYFIRPNIAVILLFAGIEKAISACLPLFLEQFILWIQDPDASLHMGILWALLIGLPPAIGSVMMSQAYHIESHVMTQLEGMVSALVYAKLLRVSPSALQQQTSGNVVNLMSSDAQKVSQLGFRTSAIVLTPIQIIVIIYLLIDTLGIAALLGTFTLVLSFPAIGVLMVSLGKQITVKMGYADSRINLVNELLTGMRVIKFYAWENDFAKRIYEFRKSETYHTGMHNFLYSGISFVFVLIPSLISLVSFGVYTGLGNELTPIVVFKSVALFNALQFPIVQAPMSLATVFTAMASVKRVQKFLHYEELDLSFRDLPRQKKNKTLTSTATAATVAHAEDVHLHFSVKDAAVETDAKTVTPEAEAEAEEVYAPLEISNGTFTWKSKAPAPPVSSSSEKETKNNEDNTVELKTVLVERAHTLKDINFRAEEGKLTAIVGSVGSGKSSLLSALLGELTPDSGHVVAPKSMAYVSQTAWIRNLTVRENILMGRPMHLEQYWKTIKACALIEDLEIFKGGDNTEIGEKGINISGGQQQRISLARALFSQEQTVLLDDPLSAVDAHVGEHLFNECIVKGMTNTTRVLVTNQWHFLSRCDYIYMLVDGELAQAGTFAELMGGGEQTEEENLFKHLLNEHMGSLEKTADGEISSPPAAGMVVSDDDATDVKTIEHKTAAAPSVVPEDDDGLTDAERRIQKAIQRAKAAQKMDNSNTTKGNAIGKQGTTLVQAEELYHEDTAFVAYSYHYLAMGGFKMVAPAFLFVFIAQSFIVLSSYILAQWSNNVWNKSNGWYLQMYIYSILIACVFLALRGVFFALSSVYASRYHHTKLTETVLHAPAKFFDETPTGRILNRFSADLDKLDIDLPRAIMNVVSIFSIFVFSLLAVVVVTPWFIFPMLVGIGVFFYIQRTFKNAAVQLQRLNSNLKSFVYQQFSESLVGVSTIRAFRQEQQFIDSSYHKINIASQCQQLSRGTFRWASTRIYFVTTIMLVSLVGFFVFTKGNAAYPVEQVGLAVTFVMSVGNVLGFTVFVVTELAQRMNSVERLKHYVDHIPVDEDWVAPGDADLTLQNGGSWPPQGKLEFKDVSMKYRPELDNALTDVNFQVAASEKVGIAGRTGSGKSSLIMCLFRMYPIQQGQIFIDGTDIATIGLHTLRSNIAIIPQDPFMFSGTIRSNIDPFHSFSDDRVWEVLKSVKLDEFVQKQPEQLNAIVAQNGDNLSNGQKQLVCVARALLKKPQLLALDEATSSIDSNSDNFIQNTIRTAFKDTTVITIAHRLNTIVDSSSVIVMNAGSVEEHGTPADLLNDSSSAFYSLRESMLHGHEEEEEGSN